MEAKNKIVKLVVMASTACMFWVVSASFAGSISEVCDRPIFKLWKTQQSNRLWTPNGDTLHSEQDGKVYTYNCFTFDEIDQFYESHEGRIENAHFYPILAGQVDANSGLDEGTEDDC